MTHTHNETQKGQKNALLGVFLFFGLVLFLGLSSYFQFFSGQNISANIFAAQTNQTPENSGADLIIPKYLIEKGETGSIEIKAQRDLGNIAGFSLSLVFPENSLSGNEISIEGTALEGKGFFVQNNLSEKGKMSIVGATGGAGAFVKNGDTVLKISFSIKDSVSLGSEIEISGEKISIISADLNETLARLSPGKLIVLKNSSTSLDITNLRAFQDGRLELVFSEEILDAKLSDFSFIPASIKTSHAKMEKNGKKLFFTGLDINPREKYKILIASSLVSNGAKQFHNGYSVDFIPEYVDFNIFIDRTTILGENTAQVFFSQILPSGITLSKNDFSVLPSNIEIEDVSLNSSRKSAFITTHTGINLFTSHPSPSFTYQKIFSDSDVDYGFNIISWKSISPSHFTATFTAEANSEDLLALSVDVKKISNSSALGIYSLEKDSLNKNIIHIYTHPQEEGEEYRVIFNPEKWHNLYGKKLGGKNSFFLKTQKTQIVEISRVEPTRFIKGDVSTLHILGRNFTRESIVKTNDFALNIQTVSSDGREMIVDIPSTIELGNKGITITSNGKNYTKENLFVVEEEIQEISVVSDRSYSSPLKVPNDNESEYSLFALIKNPDGLSNIEKVTVDLREFGGVAEVRMQPGEIVEGKQYFFLSKLKIPENVSTKSTAYSIPVTAKSIFGSTSKGKISVFVTKDINASIAPEIKNFTVSQTPVTPGNSEIPLTFSAEIFDADGNDDISRVAIDFSQIGMGTEFMDAKNSGDNESKTWFFEKKDVVVPASTEDGNYQITLTAIDKTGEEARRSISLEVSRNASIRPRIDTHHSYISPSSEIIKDESTPFKIHIKVNSPAGSDYIKSVTANLSDLGLEPISLREGMEEGRGKWFSSENLVLANNIDYGNKKIVVTVTDKDGNFERRNISIKIVEKTSHGFAPKVITNKGYSTPATAIPDGKTPISAYVFVEDKDKDISHVILQLANYAQFVGENLPSETMPGGKTCLSTRTLLCLKPILKEADGQWFYINNIVVPSGVKAGSEPYNLNVIAVDTTGKVGKGAFQLYVGDSVSQERREKPYFRFINVLNDHKIQMVLSSPLNPKNIKKEYFTISSSEDTQDNLRVYGLSVSPDGKLVTLDTQIQNPDKSYFLKVDSESLGLRSEKYSDSVLNFRGYKTSNRIKTLRATDIQSTSPSTFSVQFNQDMNALSAREKRNIEIFELGTKKKLEIESLSFLTPSILQVRTSEQTPGKKYEVYYNNFESLSGKKIKQKQRKIVEGFHISLAESLAQLHHRADFNGDKKVDFKDFTMFASVYGKTYAEAAQSGDLNNDGKVDFSDFTLMSSRYNQPAPVDTGDTTFLNSTEN